MYVCLMSWGPTGSTDRVLFIDAYQADIRELLDVVSHYNKLEHEMYNLGFAAEVGDSG